MIHVASFFRRCLTLIRISIFFFIKCKIRDLFLEKGVMFTQNSEKHGNFYSDEVCVVFSHARF
jgi:hypothetical protein